MMCAWKELLSVMPPDLRQEVDKLGRTEAQQIRMRLGKVPELTMQCRRISFGREITASDLNFVVNTACRYSPWAASGSANGYITAPGGHRIGLCGEVAVKDGTVTGMRSLRSLNIRIARDFPGIAQQLTFQKGNILIIGRPGSGKTTLLRDLVRLVSRQEMVSVVDERGELFPTGVDAGKSVDILTGCRKSEGIEMLLRTMGPDTIAVDEITAATDCDALIQAGWCGVRVLATAHGSCRNDLWSRRIYRPIIESGLFENLVILSPDKTYRTERMTL